MEVSLLRVMIVVPVVPVGSVGSVGSLWRRTRADGDDVEGAAIHAQVVQTHVKEEDGNKDDEGAANNVVNKVILGIELADSP